MSNAAPPTLVAQANPARAALTMLSDPGNTDKIYFGYDSPNVTAAGTGQGVPIVAGGQATEAAPSVFTGEVYAISPTAGQVLIIVETTDEDIADRQ